MPDLTLDLYVWINTLHDGTLELDFYRDLDDHDPMTTMSLDSVITEELKRINGMEANTHEFDFELVEMKHKAREFKKYAEQFEKVIEIAKDKIKACGEISLVDKAKA